MDKKILIDTSLILKPKTGVGAYVETLIEILKTSDVKYDLCSLNLPSKLKFKQVFHLLWMNLYYPFKKGYDIMIFPNFFIPSIKNKNSKYISVIHDLASYKMGLDYNGKYTYFLFKFGISNALKNSDTIITVSDTIKQELIEKFHIDEKRVNVVHNAIAPYFMDFKDNIEILKKYGIEDKKYILSVATFNKRKNIPSLIKAFEEISNKYPEIKLVLVGGMGNEDREKLTKHPNIIFTGYVPDEEIPILYKHGLIYIFPSLYEGFGTPIMEAQYSSTALLCSDIPVFREVAGSGAEFCTPDKNGIKNAIELLINDENKRNIIIELGQQNVKRFDIDKVKKQLRKAIYD